MTANELGRFLRARRSRVGPDEVGLTSFGPRRVPGLRREEVAVVAGVNVDYYARLEQGRERNPSAPVVDALARALVLDEHARAHLFRLAGVVDPAGADTGGTVAEPVRMLLRAITSSPAMVVGPALDVLARNTLADALFSPFTDVDNLARMVLVDPAGRGVFVDWEAAAEATVAVLNHAAGAWPDDRRVTQVIGELTATSDAFARLAARQDVRPKHASTKQLHHPDVGALQLTTQALDVPGFPGQQLHTYLATPGTESSDRLALLGSLAATRRSENTDQAGPQDSRPR